MAKPKMIGTVNGYVNSVFKMGRKRLAFDGTTKGLVAVAVANGAKDGQKLLCNYGGTSYDNCDTTMIIETQQFDGSKWASRKW